MRAILYLMILLGFTSCSSNLRPFTQRMYDDFNWSDNEIQKIQFYLSDDVRLWRDRGTDYSNIEGGVIKIVDGREIEEVLIPRNTPGVVLFSPKSNRFAVSFDDDDDRFLMFGPNPKMDGRYVLLGKDWGRRQGKITYGGKTFNVDNNSAYASLLVDIDAARKRTYKRQTADGRRVED